MRDLELDDYTAYLGQNVVKPDMTDGKSLYIFVVHDSAGVERSFAEALNKKQEEVLVFEKLPSAFKIDTPLAVTTTGLGVRRGGRRRAPRATS